MPFWVYLPLLLDVGEGIRDPVCFTVRMAAKYPASVGSPYAV